MMKNFLLFAALFLYASLFGQNSEIKDASGKILTTPFYHCNPAASQLQVADYFSSGTSSAQTLPIGTFNSILNDLSGEQDVEFSAPVSTYDMFSKPIDLGFNFTFFNTTYTQVVVGSNGRLVFTNDPVLNTLNDTSNFIDRHFLSPPVLLPSVQYNQAYKTGDLSRQVKMAQIFAGYTRLRINPATGKYKFKKFNNGTNKGILITFQSVIPHNGSGLDLGGAYTSRVILFDDGRAIINVLNKTAGSYNAILGMQNENGDVATVPTHSNASSNYNNGNWASESGNAFVYTTGLPRTPTYLWQLDRNNDGSVDETSNTRFFPNYTPTTDEEKLSIRISFLETPDVKTSTVIFKKIQQPVIESKVANCTEILNVSAATYNPDLTYEWFRTGTSTAVGTGNVFNVNQSGTYYVRATHPSSGSCQVDSAPVSATFTSTLPAFNPGNVPLYFCETIGAFAGKDIDLLDYYPENPAHYTVRFFTNGGVPVPNHAMVHILANSSSTFVVVVEDPVSGCKMTQAFTIRLDSLPFPLTNVPIRYCYGSTVLNASIFNPDTGTHSSHTLFDYEYSTDGVNYVTSLNFNPKVNSKIWYKIKIKNPPAGVSCQSILIVNFTEGIKITANTPNAANPDFQQCVGSSPYFDLAKLFAEINPSANVTITFHESLSDAQNGSNAVPYHYTAQVGDTTLYIRVVDNATGCSAAIYPTIKLTIYPKPSLKVTAINKTNCSGNSVFNLTQSIGDLVNYTAPVVPVMKYYSAAGVELTGSQITNYNELVSGPSPYIIVFYNPGCSERVNFALNYYPKPVSLVSQISVCEERSYTLQQFKEKVVSHPADFTLTDLSGNPLPGSFSLLTLPVTVHFKIKDNNTGCVSDPQQVVFQSGALTPIFNTKATYTLCDDDFDGKTTFQLDTKKIDFTNDPSAVFEYFRDSGYSQSIPAAYTNETAFNQTVYVRITVPGRCPSYGEIKLFVNTPTESTTLLPEYFICYGDRLNIDGGPENDQWEWSTGENKRTIIVDKAGSYSVKLINSKGCFYIHHFIVSADHQPKIDLINQTNSSIEVIASGGEPPYRYYFNGVGQSSNILYNPTASSYMVQVESKTGCLGEPKTVYFVKINNAFSPNGDGLNDTWFIENLDQMENISLLIVDRYGAKIFESNNKNNLIWNGKSSSGHPMPTSSYWYMVSWHDPVTTKNEQRQGWIFLKNRN